MGGLFLTVLNMSLTASFVIAAICLARLLMRRAPRVISYALWAVALFNLVCPFKPESALSLIPFSSQPVPLGIGAMETPLVGAGVGVIDGAVNAVLPAGVPAASVNPLQIWITAASYVWLAGAAALMLYAAISYLRLKARVALAVRVEGDIYETDRISSPFILGLARPRIYIPAGMDMAHYGHIIEHERTHIRRRDYLVAIAAFLALAVHWFNPLVWMAYFLMLRDMESSCDEAVLRRSSEDIRREYSSALVSFSSFPDIKNGLASPLAFGESGVRERVRDVLKFKRHSWLVIALAVALAAALSIGFAVSKKSDAYPPSGSFSLFGYISDINLTDMVLYFDEVEWLTVEKDSERLEALGFSDLPGGFAIHNPDGSVQDYAINPAATVSVVDWDNNGQSHREISLSEFAESYAGEPGKLWRLSFVGYGSREGGEVVGIVEQYLP